MECFNVQQLLAFVDRKAEELDETERDLVRQHLEECPVCAELAQAERRQDETLGAVLRDVSVPADLKQKVMNRLAAERGAAAWKWGAALLVAASVLIASGTYWYLRPLPTIGLDDLHQVAQRGAGWDEATVEKYFADEGLRVDVPSDLNFQFLRQIEIVEFNRQRVAKLSFNDGTVQADVFILPHRQFDAGRLPGERFNGFTKFQVVHKENFTYVIFYRGGDLDVLMRQMN